MSREFDDVLVVTVRKSFWASSEAESFPHRISARVFYGHSNNLFNSLVVTLRALFAVLARRPRVVVLGSVERTVPWFIRARRLGLLGRAKLVVTNQLHLADEQLREVDANIVYSKAWLEGQRAAVRQRSVFTPLPADGDFETARRSGHDGRYVFSGGGAGRDFPSLIKAIAGTPAELEIVTFSPDTLDWDGELPANCRVLWRMPVDAFLERMAGSQFVVVPLADRSSDFGQTTVVQALSLGKAVVATRSPGVVDYVEDGAEGLLVEAGDIAGYEAAVRRLWEDDELRRSCEQRALVRAGDLTYAAFAERLRAVCESL